MHFTGKQAQQPEEGGVLCSTACAASVWHQPTSLPCPVPLQIIVGYNKTAGVGSPDSYWIIRNSWGNWGDGESLNVGRAAAVGGGMHLR